MAIEERLEGLIDGDSATSMSGRPLLARGQPIRLIDCVPRPVADLVGVETGKSDLQELLSKQAQFWWIRRQRTFDTPEPLSLGLSDESAGRPLFAGCIPRPMGCASW